MFLKYALYNEPSICTSTRLNTVDPSLKKSHTDCFQSTAGRYDGIPQAPFVLAKTGETATVPSVVQQRDPRIQITVCTENSPV